MEEENIEKQQIESKVNEVFATMSKYEAREEFASFLRNYKSMLNSKPEFANSNLGKEIEILTRRLSNENYIKKAPASLIQETKDSVELKSQELQTMKTEYNQI